MRSVAFAVLVFAASCQPSAPPSARPARAAPPPQAAAGSRADAARPLWFEDDYAGALARARASKVPLFVDAAAVWCHTCKAMRAYVLDEPSLDKTGYVWLSFDVERPENGELAARYPTKALPTFFVVDASDESVHGRWEGAATVAQMRQFLRDARRSIELAHAGELAPEDPLALLLAGHRAEMKRDHTTSARSFARALAVAPPSWPRRSDALQALIVARQRAGESAACIELALATLGTDSLGRSSTLADFAGTALACAQRLPPTDPRVPKLRARVARELFAVAEDSQAPMSPDDRADALRMVWDAHEALGERAQALEAARVRLEVLEAGAKAAPNPSVASTYDGARVETLVFLGRPRDALGFLAEHERALPDDYNPPHRLAVAYEALGDHASALAAIDRAIAKSWGLRKARQLGKRADILLALGKRDDARATLEAELSHLRSLPEAQQRPEIAASVAERLRTLAASPTP